MAFGPGPGFEDSAKAIEAAATIVDVDQLLTQLWTQYRDAAVVLREFFPNRSRCNVLVKGEAWSIDLAERCLVQLTSPVSVLGLRREQEQPAATPIAEEAKPILGSCLEFEAVADDEGTVWLAVVGERTADVLKANGRSPYRGMKIAEFDPEDFPIICPPGSRVTITIQRPAGE